VEAPAETWARHGNTLSVGPLHLLRRIAERGTARAGDLGLVIAIGPGLTCCLLIAVEYLWQANR
jgi:predicted naringenin-chalcone synthase